MSEKIEQIAAAGLSDDRKWASPIASLCPREAHAHAFKTQQNGLTNKPPHSLAQEVRRPVQSSALLGEHVLPARVFLLLRHIVFLTE